MIKDKLYSTYLDAICNKVAERTVELSGTPPLSFKSKGKPLSAWSITGKTFQDGTPTPENPVEVQGVGDYDSETGMYKIPVVTSADGTEPITTPIYLDKPLYKIGDYADSINYAEQKVERVVRELVLTGTETWYTYSSGVVHQFYTQGNRIGGVANSSAYSTIAPYGMTAHNRNGNYGCYTVTNGDEIAFQMYGSKADFPTQTEWKAYLATQYANGTPVKMYYVLATPETETFTAPQIPTLNGTTVIDVDTAVKPESMTIKYKAV